MLVTELTAFALWWQLWKLCPQNLLNLIQQLRSR